MKALSEYGARRPRGRAQSDAAGGGGRCRGAMAFTLIELLVVVSIIALLVGVLAPALGKVKDYVERVRCSTNLDGIASALEVYRAENDEFPYVPLNGAGWGVPIGSSRGVDPADGKAYGRNPTSCLFLLVRESYTPAKMFVCPGAKDKAQRESGEWWDFPSGKAVSYGLMNPYGRRCRFGASKGAREILADGSPYFDPDKGLRNTEEVVDWRSAGGEQARRGNSPNHEGRGQNVASGDGSVSWHKRADCGIDGDNIYTRAETEGGTDARGGIPQAAIDGTDEDQGPAGEYDTYIVP